MPKHSLFAILGLTLTLALSACGGPPPQQGSTQNTSATPGDTGEVLPGDAPMMGDNGEKIFLPPDANTSTTWCRAVGKRTTVEACAGYDEEIASLTDGIAAFDPPRKMIKDEIRVVRLAIARDDGTTPSRAEEMVGGDADAETRAVAIGAKMRAQLSGGAAFQVDSIGDQDKFMGRAKERVWAWNVTPKLAGKHSLSATITVLAEDGTILDNYESKAIEVDVAVSEAEATEAERNETRGWIAWLTELGKSLTELWWVWLGLAIAIAVGIWRLVRAVRTGDDKKPAVPPKSDDQTADDADAGGGEG